MRRMQLAAHLTREEPTSVRHTLLVHEQQRAQGHKAGGADPGPGLVLRAYGTTRACTPLSCTAWWGGADACAGHKESLCAARYTAQWGHMLNEGPHSSLKVAPIAELNNVWCWIAVTRGGGLVAKGGAGGCPQVRLQAHLLELKAGHRREGGQSEVEQAFNDVCREHGARVRHKV